MNRRNLEVFGYGSVLPKGKLFFLCIIVLLMVVGVYYFSTRSSDELPQIALTGQAISETTVAQEQTPTPTETQTTQEQLPTPEKKEANVIVIEDTEEAASEEETQPYYEYEEACALDIKKAEDDINDINNYLTQDQQNYDASKTTYDLKINQTLAEKTAIESKLQEVITRLEQVQNEASTQLKIKEDNINTAKQHQEEAQKKLDELQSTCTER